MGNSTNKDLAEPASGTTNWDTILNDNFSIIDSALAGKITISLGAVTTHTFTTDELQPLMINMNGGGTNCVATIPNNAAGDPISGQWLISNNSSNTLFIENIETPGTYARVSPLGRAWVISDGSTAFIVETPAFPYFDDGTKSSGSFTPKLTDGIYHILMNNGSFTLQSPALSGTGYQLFILVTNGASAGAITFSGFNGVTGPEIGTTNGDEYLIRITRVNTRVVAEIVSLQATSTSFKSAEQSISVGGLVTVAHGLGVIPSIVQLSLVCQSAEGGWTAGDTVFNVSPNGSVTTFLRVSQPYADATNVYVRYSDDTLSAFLINNKTTGHTFGITNSKWKMVISAYVL